jgi:hypothetical protein
VALLLPRVSLASGEPATSAADSAMAESSAVTNESWDLRGGQLDMVLDDIDSTCEHFDPPG